MKKNKIENSSPYVEDWLPISDIRGGLIEVKGGLLDGKQYVTGVRIEPRNIFISDEETQSRTIEALRSFYNSLNYEFWLVCCDRPVDINLYRSELEIMYNESTSQQVRKLIVEDLNKCDMFTGPQVNAVDTEFYILFKDSANNKELIQKKIHGLISGLASAGLISRQITDDDARVILDSFFNDSRRTEYGTVMTNV